MWGFALNEEKMDESITDNLFIPYSLPLIEVLNLDFSFDIENEAPKWFPESEFLLKLIFNNLNSPLENLELYKKL